MSHRFVRWLPFAAAIVGLQACTRDLEVQADESCADHDPDAVVAFGDPDLEGAVRSALSFGPDQALTCELMTLVSTLEAPGPEVESLAGVQNLPELSFLVLAHSSVSDLTPLRGLTNLRSLTLDGTKALADVQPLLLNPAFGDTDLVHLRGTRVSCSDVAALAAKGLKVFSNCVGWWPGEGSADDAIAGNHGEITGDVAFADGRVGQALRFGGAGGYVRTARQVGITSNSPRTVAAWVMSSRADLPRCCPTPFSWGSPVADGGFGSLIDRGTWTFSGYRDDTESALAVDLEWNYHVITYDGQVVRYYVNGVPVAEDRRALNTTASPLYIGTGFDLSPDRQFEGLVDELIVYNRALPPADVKALFESY